MAKRYAFMRRDDGWLVCAGCTNYKVIDGLPYCLGDRVRYNPYHYGCSSYSSGESDRENEVLELVQNGLV